MVSALWKASSDGDLDKVLGLLNDPVRVDLEVKDPAGATPLLEAVKNGHVEIVRVLLDKGADPTDPFTQGHPEQYTSDPSILALLHAARNKTMHHGMSSEYAQDMNAELAKAYYPPPPGPYYYPGMPMPPPPMMTEGGIAYYPPLPHPHHIPDHNGSGLSNLPPPEIARMIPCRYYPACRYGTTCMFAHPQAPYIQGPLPPPAQYPPPPFDSMPPAPYPSYYPVPPPSFQAPTNGPPSSAVSPTLSPSGAPHPGAPHPPPMMHGRSPSDITAPVPAPFTGAPPPVQYGVAPPQYGPPPIPVPISSHSPITGPHSPQQAIYPPTSPSALVPPPTQYPMQPGVHVYPPPPPPPPQSIIANGNHHDMATSPKSPTVHSPVDPYAPPQREPYGHQRRGGARRPSFGIGRKPPCLFFPAGRCKNGDDCRFPHVMPDGSAPHQPGFMSRGGHRQRPSIHTNGTNGLSLEDRFANLSAQDHTDATGPQPLGEVTNGGNLSSGSSRSQSTEPSSRPRGPSGYKNNMTNGYRHDKKHVAAVKPQRVPSADEFPVLSGASTPPLRSPGAPTANGWAGPTAAQVLQAPPPPRKDSQPSTRGVSPANGRPGPSVKDENKPETNVATIATPQPNGKMPISFATVAAPEVVKDVAVTA